MDYVYDSSFVGTLIIPDEKILKVEKAHLAINKNKGEKIYVPLLLWYEIANVFKNLIRRKRYNPDDILLFFPAINNIKLTTDFEYGANYSQKIFSLCNDYNLSSYDAVYLELAERKKAVLCTLDGNLKTVAKKYGVTVLNTV